MLLPIATAVLSVTLLLAISVWNVLSKRRLKRLLQALRGQATAYRDFPELNKLVIEIEGLPIKGGEDADIAVARRFSESRLQMWMGILVTVGVGASALYIIISNHYGQDSLKWAYGAVGTVIGYWLKK